jgi:uncharacterized protein YndB with AHSA1/START domain
MSEANTQTITVETAVNAPAAKVWTCWTEPQHITQWNNASDDWHTPTAENDLQTGGRFCYRMAAKDGSASFDFGGTYTSVKPNTEIAYTIDDGRTVTVTFTANDGQTKIVETFEAEDSHSIEMQRSGWQAILDNFKKYVETH